MHGPIPVSGETFGELSGPLVHTDSPENRVPRDWSIRISLELIWTNGTQISLEVLVYTGIGP